MINMTNPLPLGIFNNTVNFLTDGNFSTYINNQQDIYRLTRQSMC